MKIRPSMLCGWCASKQLGEGCSPPCARGHPRNGNRNHRTPRSADISLILAATILLTLTLNAIAASSPVGRQQTIHPTNAVSSTIGPKTPSFAPGMPPVNRDLLHAYPLCFSDSRCRAEAALRAVVDDDPSTAIVLAPGEELEMEFLGAQRWMNRISIFGSGGAVQIVARDWRHAEIPVETVDLNRVDAWETSFEGIQVEAIVLRAASNGSDVRVIETHAYFDVRDPDDAVMERAADDSSNELLIEWVNDYPGSSDDLSMCDDDAQGLKNALPATWSKTEYSNSSVWEDDLKRTGSGGQEATYADPKDFVYYSGHGSSAWDWTYLRTNRTVYYGNQSHDDAHLVPGEADNAWGDADMEWICFAACKVLEDDTYWANAMRGLHLMCGWKSNMRDKNMGGPFGNYMVSTGASDAAWKIKQAWFQAGEDTHGSGYTARVAGETDAMGNDYLWGQGNVGNDPSVDNTFSRWEQAMSKDGEKAGAPDAGTDMASMSPGFVVPRPSGLRPMTGNLVRLPAANECGKAILYDPALFGPLATTMNRYHVVPVTVTPAYVQEIADRICGRLGRMCGGVIGADGAGNLWMVSGTDRLMVSIATGAVTLVDGDRWLAERSMPASLPTPAQARSQAASLLTLLDRFPTGGSPDLTAYFIRSNVERGTGQVLSSLTENIQVNFQRTLGGYPVIGPGANDAVVYGDGEYVERWSEGGWRGTTAPEPMTLIAPETIMQLLATHGSDCTIDGITPPADSIYVNSIATGYHEYDRWTSQTLIEPIYILNTTLFYEDRIPEPYEIHVNAVQMPPTGVIDGPPDGSWFDQGSSIPFQAHATGGTPPYTYEWTSDVDGLLGSGPSIQAVLSVAHCDSVVIPHSVTLRVSDAVGMSTRVIGHVGVRSTTNWATHNVGEVSMTVTDQGIVGFTNADVPHDGVGLVFGGNNALYIGGPWFGTSQTYVANRDYQAEPAQDWTVSDDPDGHMLFGGHVHSSQDGYAIFDDSGHPSPKGARIEQQSWAFGVTNPATAEQRGIILNYIVNNEGSVPPGAYLGVFLDLDIGDGNQNSGIVDAAAKSITMWTGTGPYVGLALLRPGEAGNLSLIRNETYVWPNAYIQDADKFLFLNGGDSAHRVTQSDQPRDWSMIASAGPLNIQPGVQTTVTFALAAGNSQADVAATLTALRTRYYQEILAAGISDGVATGTFTRLLGTTPNPFRSLSAISFEMARTGPVRLSVYDVTGREMRRILDATRPAGRFTEVWDGRDDAGRAVSSGVYWIRMHADDRADRRRIVLIR